MAQRTVCFCDGKYIGIETIYTIIDGKQINIPEKLKELRMKSRGNQLFCPCGCGSNLILVAGDRNLREQHFRLKDGESSQECRALVEGRCSVDSRIVLKCWLDDKLHDGGIESRVPICAVDDVNRKYEFTLLSRERKIAISYCHERANLSDEKFNILENNSKNIRVIYVVDCVNGGGNGQYPEGLMKIQERQGYCLFLSIADADYYKAKMKAVFYLQNINGLWQELSFAEGWLKEFDVDGEGNVLYNGNKLSELAEIRKNSFAALLENKRLYREQEEKRRAENLAHLLAEEERKRSERQKYQEEQEKEWRRKKEEAERCRAELEQKKRIEEEKRQEEARKRDAEFKQALASGFVQQDSQIRDAEGNRWVKCEFCGKIAKESEFSFYGGIGRINLGTCSECLKKNPVVKEKTERGLMKTREKFASDVCPDCGGQLREKNGRFGRFMGCGNYPKCSYTRKIRP